MTSKFIEITPDKNLVPKIEQAG
jgi:hypothetical protein